MAKALEVGVSALQHSEGVSSLLMKLVSARRTGDKSDTSGEPSDSGRMALLSRSPQNPF
jgi:hypothetical protein